MANGDTSKREFAFKLTPEQVDQRKNGLVRVESEIDEENSAKKGEMSVRNEALRALRKDRGSLLEACTTGYEKREVEVREEWDFKTNRVIFKRLDTGEQIEERAMSGGERQEDMFSDDEKLETQKKPKAKANGKGKTTDKPTRARARKGRLEAVE